MNEIEVTRLFARYADGDARAAEELLPWLVDELRRVAARCMRHEREGHTLQATALVNEAWLRLCDPERVPRITDRQHFVRVAARAMRNVLIDHARLRDAAKRGGGREREPDEWLDGWLDSFEAGALDVLALDAALEKFARLDPECARMVELRYFAGLSIDEAARVLERSPSWVDRSWRTARLWLQDEIERQTGP